MRSVTLPRIYFGAYGLASAGVAIADTFFGSQVAAQTAWGHAHVRVSGPST